MSQSPYQIVVSVRSEYLAEQSQPEQQRYAFAYHIRIHNQGELPAQLLSRHWLITDGNGDVQEVRGAGVVGQQPLLAPGEHFDYSSGTLLTTAVGIMQGSYQMVAEDGNKFEAEIPSFMLSMPRVLH